jgi:hypothetical protein
MTTTTPAALEAEAREVSRQAQFEFSPIQRRFLQGRAADLMAQAQTLRTAEFEELAR